MRCTKCKKIILDEDYALDYCIHCGEDIKELEVSDLDNEEVIE
ncbi:MAG: hypothetical protein Q8O30_06455 [Candidatus Omnitrophota bacterium]|nr:hypothetical protein [Candidatus Omnitrophota bacterium]